jgi:hypothetical protein
MCSIRGSARIFALFYLLIKVQSVEQGYVALTDLLSLLSVTTVDQVVIEHALTLPYPDFEDAVQMMAAVSSGAQYLVTRKLRDYAQEPLPAIQPAELLALV